MFNRSLNWIQIESAVQKKILILPSGETTAVPLKASHPSVVRMVELRVDL